MRIQNEVKYFVVKKTVKKLLEIGISTYIIVYNRGGQPAAPIISLCGYRFISKIRNVFTN